MTDAQSKNSFYQLNPDLVLDIAELVGVPATGRLIELNSYENRAYIVEREAEAKDLVVKCYRPGRWSKNCIKEEHSFLSELVEQEVPVIAPVSIDGKTLLEKENLFFSIFPRTYGRIQQELNLEQLAVLARLMGRIHNIGQSKKARHRPQLDFENFVWKFLEDLLDGEHLPENLKGLFDQQIRNLFESYENQYSELLSKQAQRIHGDLHHSNLLWVEEDVTIFDFDDFVSGPRIQDFWLLLGPDFVQDPSVLETVRRNYEVFMPFPHEEIPLIPLLRKIRLLRHAAWLNNRWEDPAFPKAFPYFQEANYFNDLARDLLSQNEVEY